MHNIEEMIEKNPHRVMEIINDIASEYGEEVYDYFNCHIKTEEEYNKYISYLKNFDKTTGGHWSLLTIEQKAQNKINFDEKDYTLYDFAYLVNMIYSDRGDLMSVDNIFTDAQRMLEEDADYCGDPSERAYHAARKKEKYFN